MISNFRSTALRNISSSAKSFAVRPAANRTILSAAVRTSFRCLTASGRIQAPPRRLDRLSEETVPQPADRDEIDFPLEQLLQPFRQVEEGVEPPSGRQRAELDQKVEVAAVGVEVVGRGRPEQVEPRDPESAAEPVRGRAGRRRLERT